MIATNIQFMKNAEFRTLIKELNICITTFMPHNCNKNNWIMHITNLRGIDLTISPKLYVQKFTTFASEWLSKYSTTFV